MDLKTFVAETLTQVANGIKQAQQAETGALIAIPKVFEQKGVLCIAEPTDWNVATRVHFDVALTVSNSDSTNIGGGLKIFSMNLGGSTEEAETNTSVSRVQFDVVVQWPACDGGDSIGNEEAE